MDVENRHGTISLMSFAQRPRGISVRGLFAVGGPARRVLDAWPLTALGVAVAVVAAVAVFRFGYGKLDLVLLVVGYGGAGLLAISLMAVSATAMILRFRMRGDSPTAPLARFETGRSAPTGFTLPSLRWLPLVRIRWSWEEPSGTSVTPVSERSRLYEHVQFNRRGVFELVRRRILVEDAFGLARVGFRLSREGTLESLPHLGGLRRLPVLTSLTGGDEFPHPMGLADGDRVETRRYIPGDPARFIHWKAFGRTRKLMVRVPERSLSRARRTVAYLVAGPHDEAAAAAARAAIEEEALGRDWQFGADGAPEPTSDRSEALHKVMVSSGAEVSGAGMRRFLAEVDRQGPAAFLVFAPPVMGEWISELGGLAQRRVGRVRVVLAIDAVREEAEPAGWRRWVFSSRPPEGVSRSELEQVGRALGQLRCEVVMIDRPSGRVLGDASRVTTWTQRAA
ncbi:MAG: DUF58 domain-containing protein [Myxococcota bacterium]